MSLVVVSYVLVARLYLLNHWQEIFGLKRQHLEHGLLHHEVRQNCYELVVFGVLPHGENIEVKLLDFLKLVLRLLIQVQNLDQDGWVSGVARLKLEFFDLLVG